MRKKLLLSLVSCCLCLVSAEVLVRLLHAAPDVSVIQKGRFRLSANPKIGFEPVPGLEFHGAERSFYDYEGKSNALGYRDVEHEVRKPPGVYRVLVIGDSLGAGLKVERYEDTFPPILEGLLRQGGLNAEVLNFSVSGYNTQQEVETLKDRGLAYAPDLVLVAYTLGDRERLDGGILETLLAEEKGHGGRSTARVNPYLVRSALYRFLIFRVLAPHPPGGAGGEGGAGATAPAADAAAQRYLDLVSGDTVAEYFGVLRDLSRQHHFDVSIAVFPHFVKNFGYYRHADQHAFAREQALKNGLHLVDLLAPEARCRETSQTPINVDNYHPSPAGHRCAAEAMAQAILGEIRKPGR